MVSHVEITEEYTEEGEPRRVIKVTEIYGGQERRPQNVDQGEAIVFESRLRVMTGPNYFDRLPNELLERILNFAGMRKTTSAASLMDPFEAGWKNEEEVIQEALRFGSSMGILRRVCWRFFDLATPLLLRRLVISEAQWGKDRRAWGLVGRLAKFLSVTRGAAHGSCMRRGQLVPYGHHVRQLIISNRTVPASVVCWLLETVCTLLPNLTALGGLNLSHMSRLLSPTIRFPRLASLTGIDLAASSELWTAGFDDYDYDYPVLDSAAIPPTPLAAAPNQLISQEVFLGLLNHHPQIIYLSCRGLQIDEAGSNRLIALLRANQLSIDLIPSSSPRTHNFIGLNLLHIGFNSVIDLQVLRSLPPVAPYLQQLHIEAGCKVEDKSTEQNAQSWSITQLLQALPQLIHLTFIAQHNLPSRRGSLQWACSNEVLKVAPQLQSLNLRMDSFTTSDFFESLTEQAGDSHRLYKLNVWHRPTLSINPATESWSIISFEGLETLQRLARAVRIMRKAGLQWPAVEAQRRDLWLKLKDLSRWDLPQEHVDVIC
ncbi:hypothetical protein VP01_1948g2 [Puccinia sorghi]|uniref:F-box domain-containing protein n=1 Tax=Puccinia sorghi TaxID=27349 RepID=A0A0L6VCB7_9BASI|nr:hypothetical protein VP01_1948g2 [Puccinia sorghi]